jgi:hypothetical protein
VSHRKVKQPHGLRVTMSRVKSTRVTVQPGTVRSHSAVIRSRMTPSESLQVGMTQYRTGHESGVTLLLSSHESSVTKQSRKETVRVTSRFCDNSSELPLQAERAIPYLSTIVASEDLQTRFVLALS